MTRRSLIEVGLIAVLVIVAVWVSEPEDVRGPDMSEACGPSERFVVESSYIGCTRDGRAPFFGESGGGVTYGFDDTGGEHVFWSSSQVHWWERVKCAVGAESCPRWTGELSPEEVAEAREYYGLDP